MYHMMLYIYSLTVPVVRGEKEDYKMSTMCVDCMLNNLNLAKLFTIPLYINAFSWHVGRSVVNSIHAKKKKKKKTWDQRSCRGH